ncbi:prokineticin-2 isoform X1 [Neopelma chrysocephalum]|uniref:prokineticin-2 isoform X1 n=1 Tax=Neopelma chrysocephalum TaxID=114329 RepID=UPI000FCD13CE|nr:prokineticin-2 isoform X1 [Neopelma chrysocephalum]
MRSLPPLLPLLSLLVLLVAAGHGAVITGACDRDQQCGGGMCCAVSLWIRSLRMCTPMGNLGEECHPLSHRVSSLLGAADAPHLPVPAGPHLRTDFLQQIQMYAALQKRGCLLLAGAVPG